MNKTERLALTWLSELKPGVQIHYNHSDTPDFFCADGTQYEVKLIYGSFIRFSYKGAQNMRPDTIVLAFQWNEAEPYLIFSWSEVKNGEVKGLKLSIDKPRKAVNIGNLDSEIWLKFKEYCSGKGQSISSQLNIAMTDFLSHNGKQ
jgi:hypothetical protein